MEWTARIEWGIIFRHNKFGEHFCVCVSKPKLLAMWRACACSPLCSHCAKLVRQQVYKCSADTASRTCSNSVVCRKFCTVRWLSSHRNSTPQSMQLKCYSALSLKVRTSPCIVSSHSRQLSMARVAGSVFGRLLKFRYLLLTGAVGGGLAAHEVISRL